MKNYAVIGLGKFGYFVARGLHEQGVNVTVIDKNQGKVKEISETIQNAIVLDSTNFNALKEAGITDFDVVIVSIGDNIEASILTVMALKDLGNRIVIAKAHTPIHGEILSKIGAFKVIYPEREAGRRLVRDVIGEMLLDRIDITNTVKIIKFVPTKKLVNSRYGELEKMIPDPIRVVAYKKDGTWSVAPDLEKKIEEKDTITVIGTADAIDTFCEKALI